MSKIAVVGTGLFGSIAARALREVGHTVITVDARREGAGSTPAACLMKPSWFTGMGKDKHQPALELLDRLYGVKDLTFRAGSRALAMDTTVHWVDPRKILEVPDHVARVESIALLDTEYWLKLDVGGFLVVDKVIVAAGVWTPELVPVPGLVGKAGVSFLWKPFQVERNFILPWAPYKQTVGFNMYQDEVWVGDGSAINQENWTPGRTNQCFYRCSAAVRSHTGPGATMPSLAEPLFGVRPYVPGAKPSYLAEVMPGQGLYVNTGGAKNGTISAAWAAGELVKCLG